MVVVYLALVEYAKLRFFQSQSPRLAVTTRLIPAPQSSDHEASVRFIRTRARAALSAHDRRLSRQALTPLGMGKTVHGSIERGSFPPSCEGQCRLGLCECRDRPGLIQAINVRNIAKPIRRATIPTCKSIGPELALHQFEQCRRWRRREVMTIALICQDSAVTVFVGEREECPRASYCEAEHHRWAVLAWYAYRLSIINVDNTISTFAAFAHARKGLARHFKCAAVDGPIPTQWCSLGCCC